MDKKLFFSNLVESFSESSFELNNHQKSKLQRILYEHGFKNMTSDLFLDYIANAIKNREYAKFIFSKGISIILEIITNHFSNYKISKEEASNFDIDEILDFYHKIERHDFESYLRNIITTRNEEIILSHSLRLPQVIRTSSDLKIIPFQVSQPNL